MPLTKYKLICIDSRYDEAEEILVLWCFFQDIGEKRFVYFSRKDFNYKGNAVPNIEMHRTASLWKGKTFFMLLDDDPKINEITEDQKMKFASMFNQRISDEIEKVNEKLSSGEGAIQRKLGKLIDEGKLDVVEMMKNEIAIKGKIGC